MPQGRRTWSPFAKMTEEAVAKFPNGALAEEIFDIVRHQAPLMVPKQLHGVLFSLHLQKRIVRKWRGNRAVYHPIKQKEKTHA